MPGEVTDATPKETPIQHRVVRSVPAVRLLVGTMLTLGMFMGLRKVASSVVGATTPGGFDWWLSFPGLIAVFSVQAVSTVFGAMIASAGRRQGLLLGALLGGMCGSLFLGSEILAGAPPALFLFYLQPPILLLIGGLAGLAGSRVWPSVPILDLVQPLPRNKLSSIRLTIGDSLHPERPTDWMRILLSALVIAAGVGMADLARVKVQKASAGIFHVQTIGQGQFLSFQLAALSVLLGGIVAGAGTGAGLRHGVIAGVVGSLGAVGIISSRGGTTPVTEYLIEQLALETPAIASLGIVAFGILGVTVVGGWLGAEIFPPLAPNAMRHRRLKSTD